MRTTCLFLAFGTALLFASIPHRAFAQPVITEVMWMGSDLSSADEWLEIALADCDCSLMDFGMDLGGYRLSYLATSGEETDIFTFASGTLLEQSKPIVIASKTASQ